MSLMEIFELASYVVTVVGLPLAIYIFIHEQRKERENEDEEVFQMLSDAYTNFLELVLANPDLKLRTQAATPDLNDEQRERLSVIFDILISLFERAYLTAYDEEYMSPRSYRRWLSWEDYMREWLRREDFREQLPRLLQGEDPQFATYIEALAQQEDYLAGRGTTFPHIPTPET